MATHKPLDPSPTPWDHKTWGFYCDACQKFFDLVRDGKVLTHENVISRVLPDGTTEDGTEYLVSYEHWCGAPARYIGYLRDGEPCSHPGCLAHISHPCEGCGRIGGKFPEK